METDGSPDPKFRKIKIAEDIAESTGKAYELCTKAIQENLSGKKCKEQRQEIKHQIDFGVQQTFMYSWLWHFDSNKVAKVLNMFNIGKYFKYFISYDNRKV